MKSSMWFLSILFIGSIILYADTQKELSDINKLKVENIRLKTQLLQCSEQVARIQISSEQQKLLPELRKELDAKDTDSFDWNTGRFTSK